MSGLSLNASLQRRKASGNIQGGAGRWHQRDQQGPVVTSELPAFTLREMGAIEGSGEKKDS